MIRSLLTLALITSFTITTSAQDVWIKRDSVNGPPRGACASFELKGEGFVATGINMEEFKRKMYSYDLEQDDWDDELSLGGETGGGLDRASAIGFSAGGFGFIGLGTGTSSLKKDLWRYDPETETWTQMADFEGEARTGAVAFAVDNVGFVGTGQSESGLHDDFYKYVVETNTWEAIGDFDGLARKEAVGFKMGGKGYIGTGRSNTGYLKDFWEYDPTEDDWSQKADFPGTPRMGAVGCGVFPSAYLMLGEDNSFEYQDDVWEWNYFGNVWTQRADYMGGPRTQANAFAVDGRVFVGLGYDGVYHDDFYEYDRVLSTNEEYMQLDFKAFPNPTSEYLTIQTQKPIQEIRLYDMQGKIREGQIIIDGYGSTSLRISGLDKLSKGSYSVVLFDAENNRGSKIILIQ